MNQTTTTLLTQAQQQIIIHLSQHDNIVTGLLVFTAILTVFILYMICLLLGRHG